MQYKDYYKILGVERGATQDDIKRAYRKLARKFHPDVSKEKDAEARFKEVNEANEVLRDPEKRAAYDRLGANWKAGQEFRPPPDWDTGFEFSGGGPAGGNFSDFFESLFGGASPFGPGFQRRPGASRGGFHVRGEDHRARIRITVEEAFRGGEKMVRLEVPQTDAVGHVGVRERSLRVKIPPGVTEGRQIRLPGQGAGGLGSGPAGDLYLEIELAPHPLYRVEGKDVHVELPVTPWEAALGAKVEVPTLAGAVDLSIPAGSRSGQRLRLRGRGFPGTPAGDQYVVLQIVTPPADSEEKRRLYEEMARKMPFNPRAGM